MEVNHIRPSEMCDWYREVRNGAPLMDERGDGRWKNNSDITYEKLESKNYQSLNMSMPTIQLEVDMMERSASGKSKVSKKGLKERSKWNIGDWTKTI